MTIKIGNIFNSNKCGKFKVIKYKNSKKITVRFIKTGFETEASSGAIYKGNVKDYLYPSFYSVGFIGGKDRSNTTDRIAYNKWTGMLQRCYSKSYAKRYTSYIGCSVCDEWRSFHVFVEWFDKNYPKDGLKYDIDKDLTILGNRQYRPEACSFVPPEINRIIENSSSARGDYPVGVSHLQNSSKFRAYFKGKHIGLFTSKEKAFMAYKKKKEDFIKQQARKYKGRITKCVYDNLWAYEVIDDSQLNCNN